MLSRLFSKPAPTTQQQQPPSAFAVSDVGESAATNEPAAAVTEHRMLSAPDCQPACNGAAEDSVQQKKGAADAVHVEHAGTASDAQPHASVVVSNDRRMQRGEPRQGHPRQGDLSAHGESAKPLVTSAARVAQFGLPPSVLQTATASMRDAACTLSRIDRALAPIGSKSPRTSPRSLEVPKGPNDKAAASLGSKSPRTSPHSLEVPSGHISPRQGTRALLLLEKEGVVLTSHRELPTSGPREHSPRQLAPLPVSDTAKLTPGPMFAEPIARRAHLAPCPPSGSASPRNISPRAARGLVAAPPAGSSPGVSPRATSRKLSPVQPGGTKPGGT